MYEFIQITLQLGNVKVVACTLGDLASTLACATARSLAASWTRPPRPRPEATPGALVAGIT